MRRLYTLLLVGCLAVGSAAGCESANDDRILGIDATGALTGIAYLDRDGNGRQDSADPPVAGLEIGLALPGAPGTLVRATTDDAGLFAFDGIDVGSYELVVDVATIPDNLVLVAIDSARMTIGAGDTVTATIRVGFPPLSVAEARRAEAGLRVAIHGVALNDLAAFGDRTVHLADASGVLRVIELAGAPVAAGDSVRVVGTLAVLDGQPVLSEANAFVRGQAAMPEPVEVSAAVARTANDGALDAALVRVEGASVLDVRTTLAGDQLLVVDDGSGSLEVVLDRDANFGTTPLPGAILDATGLLVPSPEAPVHWTLKPRSAADLHFAYPTATLAEVRSLEPGKRIAVEGIALTGWATFGDATVHLADETGALRSIRVARANLFAGDHVRLLGTVAVLDGQTVLADATASILATGATPAPRPISTAQASAAAGGLDAALVRITQATIGDTATTAAGDFLITVDDGSGPLQVLLDQDTGIQRAPYQPDVTIHVTGVLVPRPGGGAWMLKPRSSADLQID